MLLCALDIGGTKTIAAAMDERGHILAQRRWPTDTSDGLLHLEQCAVVLEDLCRHAGVSGPAGLGVAVPGMVDSRAEILLVAPFAGWQNLAVRPFLQDRLRCPVFMDNDANACAVGEMRFGYGDRYGSYLWMTISTGVGGALVSRGRLLRGAAGLAGEIGHVKVEYADARLCSCGQRGCLEAQASGTAITAATAEAAKDPAFRDLFVKRNIPPDAEGCARLAAEHSPQARHIYAQAADYIARGISCAANLLDLEAVILGGGVAGSLPLMLPDILASCRGYITPQLRVPDIVPSKLAYEAALYGALALALNGVERG